VRSAPLTIAIFASLILTGSVGAQAPGNERARPTPEANCPPDVKGEPPTTGSSKSNELSDKLAESKGVICPPTGVDRDMQVAPPGGGQLKVIPPPGSPGGDQSVQPK
jgi:hypothetical protein